MKKIASIIALLLTAIILSTTMTGCKGIILTASFDKLNLIYYIS